MEKKIVYKTAVGLQLPRKALTVRAGIFLFFLTAVGFLTVCDTWSTWGWRSFFVSPPTQ